jgi:DNA-binding beta-propeller fold protein YncE
MNILYGNNILFKGAKELSSKSHLSRSKFVAYVVSFFGMTVTVVDLIKDEIIATIPVGRIAFDIAITPDGRFAYVTVASTNSVEVINTKTNTVGRIAFNHSCRVKKQSE